MLFPKHILEITDLSREQLEDLIKETQRFAFTEKETNTLLKNKSVRLIFDSNSLRTKASFERATDLMGGHHYFHEIADLVKEKDGTPREDVRDVIRSLDMLGTNVYVIRDYSRKFLETAVKTTNTPIINGFSITGHPSQIIADLAIFKKNKEYMKFDYASIVPNWGSGDVESFTYGVLMLGENITLITPNANYNPINENFFQKVDELTKRYGGKFKVTASTDVVKEVDVLYGDEWWKPGVDINDVPVPKEYQINSELIKNTKRFLSVSHYQQAHRGREITNEVMERHKFTIEPQTQMRLFSAMSLLDYVVNKL